MKNAIVGSHGTGKSTLLKFIKPHRDGKIITEIARDVMKEFGKTPQEMTKEERISFQKQVYRDQYLTERYSGHFISDRGVYDNLAYAKNTDYHLFKTLERKAKMQHQGYDNVFYVPIEFPLVEDGVRFTGNEFQQKIQNDILEIMDDFNVNYTTVTGSVEERTRTILSIILGYEKHT